MRGITTNAKAIRFAAVLTGGVAIAALGMAAATPVLAKEAKPKAAKGGGFSPAFAAAAGPLQTKIQAAQAAKAKADAGDAAAKAALAAAIDGAPAMLASAEAAATTPTDKATVGQFAVNLGGLTGNPALQQRGVRNMIDSGLLEPAKVAELRLVLGKMAYQNKDYAGAQQAFAAVVAAGNPSDEAVDLMVDSSARAGNPRGGLGELRKLVDARRAARQPVPEAWLKRADTVAYTYKLGPESVDWATLHAELYPTKFNWLGSSQLVRRFANYGPQETIDLFRLMARTGAFDNDPKIVANEYKEYIESADPRRFPGEVVKVIDQGVASGALSASTPWVAEARNSASGRIAADKASLPGLEREARAAGTGVTALSAADAYLNYGDNAKAEALYSLALQKGGVDKDRALTRLGIAQVDQGKYGAARDSFAKVGGQRLALARLWLIYVQQKDPAATPTRAS